MAARSRGPSGDIVVVVTAHPRAAHPRAQDGLGRYGEQLAADHLVAAGLTVLARNWRCARGELDLIARDGSTLVFVEVKTRSSTAYGHPAEAVGRAKSARIRRLAATWLAESDRSWPDVRFDVVAVVRPRTGAAVVEHLRGVL